MPSTKPVTAISKPRRVCIKLKRYGQKAVNQANRFRLFLAVEDSLKATFTTGLQAKPSGWNAASVGITTGELLGEVRDGTVQPTPAAGQTYRWDNFLSDTGLSNDDAG